MGWPLRNELRILINVTTFEEVIRSIALFILGDDEASPLSVDGAIEQQYAIVNALLQLHLCEVMRDDSQSFRALAVLVKGTMNSFPGSTALCRPLPHTLCLDGSEYLRPIVRLLIVVGLSGCSCRCRTF